MEILPGLEGEINLDFLAEKERQMVDQLKILKTQVDKLKKVFPKPSPFTGLFFNIYSGYKFDDEEITKNLSKDTFKLNYDLYLSPPKLIPIIYNSNYMKVLFRELSLDSVTFIMRRGISLFPLSTEDKKAVTNAAYNTPHSGLDKANAPKPLRYLPVVLLIKLCLEGVENDQQVILLKGERDTYNNSAFHLSPRQNLRASFRIHKWRLLSPETDIFSIFYSFSKAQNLAQMLLEKWFAEQGIDIEVPRFLMVYNIDICQPTNEEFVKGMYMESWGALFPRQAVGNFVQCEFAKYMTVSGYDKKESAINKIKNKKMMEKEVEYFEKEAKEGWRSEIHYELQRNPDYVLSVAYVLDTIDQSSFLEMIKDADKYYNDVVDGMFHRKAWNIKLDPKWQGYYEFGRDRVKVWFTPNSLLQNQEIERQGFDEYPPLEPLEHHGPLAYRASPPLHGVK